MRKVLLATITTLLLSGSIYTNASDCSSGGCGTTGVGLSGSQSQSNYNEAVAAPSVTMAASSTNNYVSGNSRSSFGGISCSDDTLTFAVGSGVNQMSNGDMASNISANVIYSIAIGGAKQNCLEAQRLTLTKMKRDATEAEVKACIGLVRAVAEGFLNIDFVLKQPKCPSILSDAKLGYHGVDHQKVVEENKLLKKQLKQLVGKSLYK